MPGLESELPAGDAEPADAKLPKDTRCPPKQHAVKRTACVQPVVIADDDGKRPTKAPSFDQVQSIWKKCCIDYSVKGATTVKKTSFKTLDFDLNHTEEERELFKAAGDSNCVQVFVPRDFAGNGRTGKDISGGGWTTGIGTANPKVVVVEGTVPEVVAHEVGHASGFVDHEGAGETVMKPSDAYDKPTSTSVSVDVCTKARTGAVLTRTGEAELCCMDPR